MRIFIVSNFNTNIYFLKRMNTIQNNAGSTTWLKK